MPKIANPPMVIVEWEDSAQAAPQWQWFPDVSGPPIIICRSVGFLIRDTKTEKVLAISVAIANNGDVEQASGIISIPTRCVVRITRIVSSRHYDSAATLRRRRQ